MASIPSWINSIPWDTDDTSNQQLMTYELNPLDLRAADSTFSTVGAGSILVRNYTPCGYIANVFNYWRCDFVFTFKVVKTQFHTGRLKFLFKP